MKLSVSVQIGLKLSLLAVVMAGLSACAQSPDCFRADTFCAALITDTSGLNNHGNTQNAWAGLQTSQSTGVVNHIAYIESIDARDYQKNIDFFVDAGYDAILTSGFGLQDATFRSADQNPARVFIGIDQAFEDPPPNLVSVTFAEDKMGFLAGALAARLTKTKTVGAVCETSGIDTMWRYCEGFRAGVAHTDETVKAIVIYRDRGSRDLLFNDEVWGGENARDLVQSGVDVIFAVGGGTGEGALRAASRAGVYGIGAERDQGAALGEDGAEVVTSILGQSKLTVQELMRALRSENPIGKTEFPIGYVPFDFGVQASVFVELDEILAGLESGEIKTNVTFKKP